MLGALVGDIVGSRFEFRNNKSKDFGLFLSTCRFTDDSLMTLAIARAFLLRRGRWREDGFQSFVIEKMVEIGRQYPTAGWGQRFYRWLTERPVPYDSFGNGAAMRISPVGWISESEEDVRYFSRLVTEVSHNHPEGLKGAEAVAMAIYLARTGASMATLRERMIGYYPEIAHLRVDKIREYCNVTDGSFITCQTSVPEAIVCFLESTSFEDAVRNAVSLGGDSDTQGAIAGSIAEAYWGVPPEIEETALTYLNSELSDIYHAFALVKLPRTPQKRE